MASYSDIGTEPVAGFRVTRLLGSGPSSRVWKATAPGGTEVALKIVSLAAGHSLKELQSMRLCRRIRHPNLVPLLAFWVKDAQGNLLDEDVDAKAADAPRTDVQLIIAMGLGEESLADRLRTFQGLGHPGVPRDEILRLLTDAARALDYLNRPIHGPEASPCAIQHCDVKPSNILVVGGAAQVCDLGIIQAVGAVRPNALLASAAYVAPEMIRDEKPSPATDQYSLAISYYELRTGRLPFQARSPEGACFAHLRGKLDFSRLPAPEAVVLVRATALKPEDRFPSCAALMAALQEVCDRISPTGRALPRPRGTVPPEPDPPEEPKPAGQGRARRWRPVAAVLMVLVGATVGIVGSRLSRGAAVGAAAPGDATTTLVAGRVDVGVPASAGGEATAPAKAGTPTPPPARPAATASAPDRPTTPFVLEGQAHAFASLPEAVAAARDGDTVAIHGNGPFALEPLAVPGKALTLRAAPGYRPVLQRPPSAARAFWRPLLASDAALTLEGLELRHERDPGAFGVEPALLVSCERASLRLLGCRLLAPRGAAAVVCRAPGTVELVDCELAAHEAAVCIELQPGARCELRLTGNVFDVGDVAGAALSLFARPEGPSPAPARLRLERNTVRAGRVVALRALPAGLAVEARDNHLAFRQALVSYADFPGWRRGTAWHGQTNRYEGPADWVRVEGAPAGVHGLPAWQALWQSPETGSVSTGPGPALPGTPSAMTNDGMTNDERSPKSE
jgi:Protein kinase domain